MPTLFTTTIPRYPNPNPSPPPLDLRSDARAPLGHLHGILCQWWRLLPLHVRGCPRMRSHHTHRHLRSRLPPHCRGPVVRHSTTAKENQTHEERTGMVSSVVVPVVVLCVCLP